MIDKFSTLKLQNLRVRPPMLTPVNIPKHKIIAITAGTFSMFSINSAYFCTMKVEKFV